MFVVVLFYFLFSDNTVVSPKQKTKQKDTVVSPKQKTKQKEIQQTSNFNSNMTSFFLFVNKRAINRLGIVPLAHAPVHTFKPGNKIIK